MAAVVRLKRRCDEEPLEAVVLACKRKKTEDELGTTINETPFQTILKFAGTVKNQEEDVTSHIDTILRKDKILGWRHNADVTGKVRREIKQLEQKNRLKVVNCFRNLRDSNVLETEKEIRVAGEDGNKSFTVFDVVSNTNDGQECKLLSSKSQTELDSGCDGSGPDAGYVYDLYYTSVARTDGLVDLNDLSIHPCPQSDWEYLDPEDSSDMSHEEEDEDDSNDENNWRNDYPDSDQSITEDDIRITMQMEDLNVGDGEDLSSDDADEDFVYGVSVDPQDVALYGEGYANYKARMKYELYGDEQYQDEAYDQGCSSDEDEEDPAGRFT